MNAQRPRQLVRLACVAIVGLLFPPIAGAHRLDEYLQATRISIEAGRIVVEINLTPGAAVAENVIAQIDQNRDEEISAVESTAYASAVLKSASLDIDSERHSLVLDKY